MGQSAIAGGGSRATRPALPHREYVRGAAWALWCSGFVEGRREDGYATASAEGCVSCAATSEGTRGPGVPSPESDFDPHPLTRGGAGWPGGSEGRNSGQEIFGKKLQC